MNRATFLIALLFLAFGYVGEQDYQNAAAMSCEARGGEWDGETCWKNGQEVKV